MKQQEAIIRRYITAYNDFDVEGMMADMHPGVIFENSTGGEVNIRLEGIEAFRRQAVEAASLFSQRRQEIVKINMQGDEAEVFISYTGTLAVDLPNGLKKGTLLEMKGRSVFTLRNGKIVHLLDIS